MELDQIVFLVILGSALALFVSGRMRVDLVAMLTLLALALTGILDARQALAGFSSEPALTPMRMEQPWSRAALMTSRTRSAEPMLPGLMRRHAAPASAASMARR